MAVRGDETRDDEFAPRVVNRRRGRALRRRTGLDAEDAPILPDEHVTRQRLALAVGHRQEHAIRDQQLGRGRLAAGESRATKGGSREDYRVLSAPGNGTQKFHN